MTPKAARKNADRYHKNIKAIRDSIERSSKMGYYECYVDYSEDGLNYLNEQGFPTRIENSKILVSWEVV